MSDGAPIGVLVMAYGTATGPDDIERYYTDIRGGRPPTPEHLQELQDRYAAIGNVFPLLDTTRRAGGGPRRTRSTPTRRSRRVPLVPRDEALAAVHRRGRRADARRRHRARGRHRDGAALVGHVGRDVRRTRRAGRRGDGGGPAFTFVRTYHDHPAFVAFLAARVRRGARPADRGRARERAR